MSALLTLVLSLNNTANQDTLTRALLRELRDSDLVASTALESADAPDGAKGVWGEWLKLTFSPQNLQNLFKFISERLPGQPVIEMELTINENGKSLKLKASKPEDFLAAMQQAQQFIAE